MASEAPTVQGKVISAKLGKTKVKLAIDARGLRVTEEGGKKRTLHDLTLKQIKSCSHPGRKKANVELVTAEGETLVFVAKGKAGPEIVEAVQGAKLVRISTRSCISVSDRRQPERDERRLMC